MEACRGVEGAGSRLWGVDFGYEHNRVGSAKARKLKIIIKNLGCWDLFIWLQTKGKMSKTSEGDGLYYSFCAFDALPLLRRNSARCM